eukprot:gene6702-8022_t
MADLIMDPKRQVTALTDIVSKWGFAPRAEKPATLVKYDAPLPATQPPPPAAPVSKASGDTDSVSMFPVVPLQPTRVERTFTDFIGKIGFTVTAENAEPPQSRGCISFGLMGDAVEDSASVDADNCDGGSVAAETDGIEVTEVGMNEPGEGKDETDSTFNTAKGVVCREVALGVDVTTAAEFIRVLNSKDGVRGMTARVVEIHRPNTPYDVGTLENITRYSHLRHSEEGLRCWEHYGIGPGRLYLHPIGG